MHSWVLSLHGSNPNKVNWKMLFLLNFRQQRNAKPQQTTPHRHDDGKNAGNYLLKTWETVTCDKS